MIKDLVIKYVNIYRRLIDCGNPKIDELNKEFEKLGYRFSFFPILDKNTIEIDCGSVKYKFYIIEKLARSEILPIALGKFAIISTIGKFSARVDTEPFVDLCRCNSIVEEDMKKYKIKSLKIDFVDTDVYIRAEFEERIWGELFLTVYMRPIERENVISVTLPYYHKTSTESFFVPIYSSIDEAIKLVKKQYNEYAKQFKIVSDEMIENSLRLILGESMKKLADCIVETICSVDMNKIRDILLLLLLYP